MKKDEQSNGGLTDEKAKLHRMDVERAEDEGMGAPPRVEEPGLGDRIRARLDAALELARHQPLTAVVAAAGVGLLIGFFAGRYRRS